TLLLPSKSATVERLDVFWIDIDHITKIIDRAIVISDSVPCYSAREMRLCVSGVRSNRLAASGDYIRRQHRCIEAIWIALSERRINVACEQKKDRGCSFRHQTIPEEDG